MFARGYGGNVAVSLATGIPEFETEKVYSKWSSVFYKGVLYRAKKDFVTTLVFDINDWEHIPIQGFMHTYKPNLRYEEGQLVRIGSDLYSAKAAIANSPDPFDATQWDHLNNTTATIPDYVANAAYYKGNLVRYDNTIFRAKVDIPVAPAVFDERTWQCIEPKTYFKTADFTMRRSGYYEVNTSGGRVTILMNIDADPNHTFKDDFYVGDAQETFSATNPCVVDFSFYKYPTGHPKANQSVGLATLQTANDYFKFFWDETKGQWFAKDLISGELQEV